MLAITDGIAKVRNRDQVRTKDEYLAAVLRGEAYLVFDGAMGTMLQASGMEAGELPELLCLTDPAGVTAIHRQYVEAGSQAITTNTFGANARKLGDAATVEDVFAAAVACARESGARYVAGDIGPTGGLLEPLGTMSFDEAYDLFAQEVRAADAAGADLLVIETMADLLEMKAAVLAAKENSDLPIFATMTFGEDGRTFLGTSPRIAALTLDALGVNVLGVNCSLGPSDLQPIVSAMLETATCPVMAQANAGLPSVVDGHTVYSIMPDEYANAVQAMVDEGVSVIGGCCGTNPDYIRQLAAMVEGNRPPHREVETPFSLTSAQNAVVLRGREVAVIGERINPTGKKRLKEALRTKDYNYVLNEAISQTEAGADVLDVNAGLPEIDEAATLVTLVGQIQGVSGLPLQIDSADPAAVEAAVRVYSGKPLINSVNGKQESLDAVLPVAKHYGCAVVGLTLDENGIPPTGEERFAIAARIVEAAEAYGIPRSHVAIDCLVMAASTNQQEVVEILKGVTLVKERLGVRTVLGVSNVSFGLPLREIVNATFLSAAFAAGLDMPILNPMATRYKEVVDTWRVLCAQDEGAAGYIAEYAGKTLDAGAVAQAPAAEGAPGSSAEDDGSIRHLIITGRKGDMVQATQALLADHDAMEVINEHLIPALDEVGALFEKGTFFLPQLMASAEAAKAGFDVIRSNASEGDVDEKGSVAVATVKGDIHDIGKNIVRMLLENYGYRVYDLGRDVDPELIVQTVQEHDIKLVGLSALMTTTVHNMEEAIKLLREKAPDVKVMVGGAVLNPEYARMVGADFYAKDAAESARIAGEVLGS
ncbi:homocysteine S-methyltransferase family protein [Slackia heliotrinireducens]|uniref:homocysteine S-methyltransferase family protein n=1 Tax=Slackia heliotrinireducens TaxID=84110 RepID=UPI0033150F1F